MKLLKQKTEVLVLLAALAFINTPSHMSSVWILRACAGDEIQHCGFLLQLLGYHSVASSLYLSHCVQPHLVSPLPYLIHSIAPSQAQI